MTVVLRERIGDGGFGDVWLAVDALGREVAVKILRSGGEAVSDVMDHARALARVEHPHVVRVYSIEKVQLEALRQPVDCIVMELVRGHTLSKHLQTERLTKEAARQIGHDIISAIEAIHAAGLVHGDLHVENVMVSAGRAKVIDILYRNTLAALSTASRESRIRTDLAHIRMLLLEILGRTDIDPNEATAFNNHLASDVTFQGLRDAWEVATNPVIVNDVGRIVDNLVRRVEDVAYPQGDAYAAALAAETPLVATRPLLLRLIDRTVIIHKHAPYLRLLAQRLSTAEAQEVIDAISRSLDEHAPNGRWESPLRLFKAFGLSAWSQLRPTTALRLEQLMVNDVLAGHFDIFSSPNLKRGALGTYCSTFYPRFSSRTPLLTNIIVLLRQNWYTQNYVAQYFWHMLPDLPQNTEERDRMIDAIAGAIQNDARTVVAKQERLPAEWRAALSILLESSD